MIETNDLRLRPYVPGENLLFAFPWYQDEELVYLVDGVRQPYSKEKLLRMYSYLAQYGQLYFIEILENGYWKPIGDVTLSPYDMPIVIGEPYYRGRGIGKKVLQLLISKAQDLGWTEVNVREIYDYNISSQKCFEALGFVKMKQTEKGHSYQLKLKE